MIKLIETKVIGSRVIIATNSMYEGQWGIIIHVTESQYGIAMFGDNEDIKYFDFDEVE